MDENQIPGPPPIEPPPPAASAPTPANVENQARTWNMWCHLSTLSAFVVPFGNLLGPFLVWQIKQNEIPSVQSHAKAALNFQFTVLIALLVGAVVAFIFPFSAWAICCSRFWECWHYAALFSRLWQGLKPMRAGISNILARSSF